MAVSTYWRCTFCEASGAVQVPGDASVADGVKMITDAHAAVAKPWCTTDRHIRVSDTRPEGGQEGP